jgi:predicted metalloprotease
MRWEGRRRSGHVDDRRRRRAPRAVTGGAIVILLAVLVWLLGGDPTPLLQEVSVSTGGDRAGALGPSRSGEDRLAELAAVVLADTEDAWGRVFAAAGSRYEPPTLVLFEDRVDSACGYQSSAVGPFYCPADRKLYLDLSFFRELDRRFGAPGDFAQAYVVAHEVGHHVQALLGIDRAASRLAEGRPRDERSAISVLQELQADCLAGVWGHHAARQRDFLERGDIAEGLDAAAAIGDDAIQRQAGRVVRPDAFTHGSSGERVGWFRRGLESGSVADCDTFAVAGVPLAGR